MEPAVLGVSSCSGHLPSPAGCLPRIRYCPELPVIPRVKPPTGAAARLFEGNPVDEGTTRRGTDNPVHRPPKPQVPHTTRQVACRPVNNSRGKQSSITPHTPRGEAGTSGFLCVSDSDRRVPAELGQESQASSCLRKGTPLASRPEPSAKRPGS